MENSEVQHLAKKLPTQTLSDVLPPKLGGASQDLYCQTCQVSCSGIECFRQHVAGARHRRKLKHSVSFSCNLCGLGLNSAEQREDHIRGSRHQRRLAVPELFNKNMSFAEISSSIDSFSHPPCPPLLSNATQMSSLHSPQTTPVPTYNLTTHTRLPDFLSCMPHLLKPCFDSPASMILSGHQSTVVESPCFLVLSPQYPQTGTKLPSTSEVALQMVNEIMGSIERLERKLSADAAVAFSLKSRRSSNFSRIRKRTHSLKQRQKTSGVGFWGSPLVKLRNAMRTNNGTNSFQFSFCQHGICSNLRALLNYQHSLQQALRRIRRSVGLCAGDTRV